MKKFLTAIMIFNMGICTTSAVCPGGDNPPETDSEERKAPVRRPQMVFGEGFVSIITPFTLYDVELVVRDSNGCILYSETHEELSNTYSMMIEEEYCNKVYSIELIYGDHHLFGYFVSGD